MRSTMAVLFSLTILAVPLSAEQVEGILMDKMCSAKMKTYDAAKTHTKMCASNCSGSGFGLVTSEGKFLKFDAEGDKKAAAALEATDKTENLTVAVEGDVDGDNIKVKSLDLP